MKLKTINDDIFTRGLKATVGRLPKEVGAKVWWQPQTRQAFVSTDKWANPDAIRVCRETVARIVGIQNVEMGQDAEPSPAKGTPWLRITKDSLAEGVVAAAKGDILNIINDSASKIGRAATAMGFPKPAIDFTDATSRPATINLEAGRNKLFQDPKTIAISVHGDSEFKIELPHDMATALGIAHFYPQRSADEVVERLQEIRSAMRTLWSKSSGSIV